MAQQLSPELNDISIQPLFHWYGEQEITDVNGNTFRVFIRLVGDAELNQARVFALRKSAEMRKLLKTPDSDERVALVEGMMPEDNYGLIAGIMYRKTQDLYVEASKKVRVKHPKEPASADLEAQEKYQLEVDAWQEKFNAEVQKAIEPEYDKYHKILQNKSTEQLQAEYEIIIIRSICDNTFQTKFKEMCVYLGTYQDQEMKVRFFDSFEQFDNLRSEVKEQFIEFYNALDLSTEELKK